MKLCLDCGLEVFGDSRRKYCGSVEKRTGCVWKRESESHAKSAERLRLKRKSGHWEPDSYLGILYKEKTREIGAEKALRLCKSVERANRNGTPWDMRSLKSDTESGVLKPKHALSVAEDLETVQ